MTSAPARVVTRFAPSPTGYLHVGGARTALFSWLYARHHGGQFILRIEDTDLARSTPANVAAIFDGMRWLGLTWDTEPEYQSKRQAFYDAGIATLLAAGHAYRCDCTAERLAAMRADQQARKVDIRYDRHCLQRTIDPASRHVVRFRSPDAGDCGFDDLVHGPIAFDAAVLDDFVLRRPDGLPTYNYAVVIDDHDMGITHVIRGDDHIANTPRQILVYRALGYELPRFGHIPMILGPDKAKLSKRHGATSVMEYDTMGFLPEAMNNFLARLGWSHGDQEVFTLDELVQYFDLDSVHKTAAVFDQTKLEWLNGVYIREKLTPAELLARAQTAWARHGIDTGRYDAAGLERIVATVRERAKTLEELVEGSRFYFVDSVMPSEEDRAKTFTPEAMGILQALYAELQAVTTWDSPTLEAVFRAMAETHGVKAGAVIGPARLAITGKKVSPGMWEVAEALGRDATLARLAAALEPAP